MTLAENECNEVCSGSGIDPESERVWAKLFGIPGLYSHELAAIGEELHVLLPCWRCFFKIRKIKRR